VYLSLHLQKEIIPDEATHSLVIREFDKTLGIPSETADTIRNGVIIEGNPFLYYWILARARNVVSFLRPGTTENQLFHFTRIINILFSVATLFTTWLIAKKLIKSPWFQLLPTFLLANLQMFFLLATGINYDNLVNLLCATALLLLLNIIKNDRFWLNSILLALTLGLAGLTKKTTIPFIGILFIIWLFLYFEKKPKLERPNNWLFLLIAVTIAVLAGNVVMYSRNIILYKTLIPNCHIINKDLPCDTSYIYQRWLRHNIPEKLSLKDARELGLPNLVNYYFGHWSTVMLERTVGILGHKSFYNPLFDIFSFTLIILAMLGLAFVRKPPVGLKLLGFLALFYTITLYLYNYNDQLYYAFAGYALQGRYIFPVIVPFLIFISYIIESIKPIFFKIMATTSIIILSIIGGPIQFLYFYKSIFIYWF
ncbi:MAG: hypothetical protein GX853_04210, partial [Chloroflexi bacterium]|nr:hypothetical protein [Chloroflexota bacterium]